SVDRFGLGLCQEADAAQVHAQHRHRRVARQLGAAQKCAVPAQDEHQLAATGRIVIGLHNVDIHTESAHFVGRQVQFAAVDVLGRQHAQSNPIVTQDFLNPTGGLGGLVAAGVHDEQDG